MTTLRRLASRWLLYQADFLTDVARAVRPPAQRRSTEAQRRAQREDPWYVRTGLIPPDRRR